MTNTFMLRRRTTTRRRSSSRCKRGLYAVSFGGGQVDITNGKFVFSASEAYLIEDGKVTRPVKGATLIGNGPDVLTRVTMVGNDLELDSGHRHLRQGRADRCRSASACRPSGSTASRSAEPAVKVRDSKWRN